MSNYLSLKATINANIKQNGNEEITGPILNSVLNAMVDSLAGYHYSGIATPATNPGTPDSNVFYLASEAGTYTNFGGLAVAEGEVAILKYNGTWTKEVTGAATAAELSQLAQEIDGIAEDSKTVTLAVTAGTNVTYNNSLKECRLLKGRTYKIKLTGVLNSISMYFRNADNSSSVPVNYDTHPTTATSVSFSSSVTEHTIVPTDDIYYVRFYAAGTNITNTGDMVWGFVSAAVMGVADKAEAAYDAVPKAEYAYDSVMDMEPKVNALYPGLVNTRNISPLPDTITMTGTPQVIGEVGVTLLPVGHYTLSFVCAVNSGSVTAEWTGYFDGISGGVTLIHQQTDSNGQRVTIAWDFDHPLERILVSTYSKQEGEIVFSDVQIETIAWNGYTSSPNKGSWAALPYATPYIEKRALQDIVSREFAVSYWNGKKINWNGDSVTQGIGTSRIGYVKYVNQFLKFGVVNNYAIGGTRLAHVEDVENCLVDRIEDMSTDADIVFIMANTNDYASQVPIGASDSQDESTYNGALNSIFTWLKTNYPTQPVIISTMLTRKVNYDDQSQPLAITIDQYAEAIRQKVAEYGFILYDAYKWSGLDLLNTPKDGTGVSDDGLHPNEAGALALGRKVAAFINAQ